MWRWWCSVVVVARGEGEGKVDLEVVLQRGVLARRDVQRAGEHVVRGGNVVGQESEPTWYRRQPRSYGLVQSLPSTA